MWIFRYFDIIRPSGEQISFFFVILRTLSIPWNYLYCIAITIISEQKKSCVREKSIQRWENPDVWKSFWICGGKKIEYVEKKIRMWEKTQINNCIVRKIQKWENNFMVTKKSATHSKIFSSSPISFFFCHHISKLFFSVMN